METKLPEMKWRPLTEAEQARFDDAMQKLAFHGIRGEEAEQIAAAAIHENALLCDLPWKYIPAS